MNRECFSQEIFDAFIDYLSNSLIDLKNFSLVAKSWLPRTRKHIFRRLQIYPRRAGYPGQKEEMLESFAHLLQVPEIVRSIKVVMIGEKSVGDQVALGAPGMLAHLGHAHAHIGHGLMLVGGFSTGTSATDKVYPCSLNALPLKSTHALSYRYPRGTAADPLSAQVCSQNMKTLVGILRNFDSGLKHLYLHDPAIYFPPKPYKRQAPPLDPFEALAAFAPALETLCLSNFSAGDRGYDLDGNLDGLRHILKTPSTAHGKAAGEKKIYLTRFLCTSASDYDWRLHVANQVLNVLLFENRFLDYSNLTHLAIDCQYIPLFIHRSNILQNVKHLTLLDQFLKDDDALSDIWNYNRARLSLPSLATLQLVISGYESILALCRVILGPSQVATPARSDFPQEEEYPGNDLYVSAAPTPVVPYPEAGSGLCLQILFPFKNWFVNMSMNARVDETLHSYLDLDSPESNGPLERITVNRFEVPMLWPKTAGSGRLSQGQGDSWWDANGW